MEVLERQNDSIDKLTSLVSKMNVKLDRKEAPYMPRFIKTDLEAKVGVDNKLFNPRVNDCGQSTDKSGKRGVTVDAMEALERQNDSIDKLTSLVSKMNVKLDRKEAPYMPRFIKTDLEAKVGVDNKLFNPTIDHLAGIEAEIEGIIIITIEITDPNIDIDLGMITDVITEEIPTGPMRDAITTDRTMGGEITIGKTIEIGKIIVEIIIDKETGVRVERG